jgi:hypothetical protein
MNQRFYIIVADVRTEGINDFMVETLYTDYERACKKAKDLSNRYSTITYSVFSAFVDTFFDDKPKMSTRIAVEYLDGHIKYN